MMRTRDSEILQLISIVKNDYPFHFVINIAELVLAALRPVGPVYPCKKVATQDGKMPIF